MSCMHRMTRLLIGVRELLADEWPILLAWTVVVLCYAIAAWCFMRVLK